MTVRALDAKPCGMGFMGKLDIIERNSPFLDANMAERGTGHVRPDFLGFVASIDGCQGLFGLVVGYVEKLDRILDVVDTPAQVDEAKVVPSLVEEGL
jgi:hypothetical protein